MKPMQYDDGRIGWYFDCADFYADIDKDADGKYSIYFRDRKTQAEAWADQAEPPVLVTGTGQIAELQSECASKQAKIDSLMLEYCPHEMTAEQIAEWARHQKPAAQPKGDGNG